MYTCYRFYSYLAFLAPINAAELAFMVQGV